MHESHEEILAVFTVLLALFTLFLWGATVRLARETKNDSDRQYHLARQQFMAAHRPKIIVHTFEESSDADTNCIGAMYTCVNAGTSDARITEIGGRIFFTNKLTPGVQIDMASLQNAPLKPGERTTQFISSGIQESVIEAESDKMPSQRTAPALLCVGCIRYTDSLGTMRQTGFCRAYDFTSRCWLREENSDYEYAY